MAEQIRPDVVPRKRSRNDSELYGNQLTEKTMATKDVSSVLNDLIETCKDGAQGFRTAAEKVKDPSLQSLFSKYASQRAEYAKELQTLVTQIGGDPATSGHVPERYIADGST